MTSGIIQPSIVVTDAPMLRKYGKDSALQCSINSGNGQNSTHCNTLANICVLQLYDSSLAACTLFQNLYDQRKNERYHPETIPALPWAVPLPWLYFDDNAEIILRRKDLFLEVSLVTPDVGSYKVSELNFVLSTYKMSGEWLGLKNVA